MKLKFKKLNPDAIIPSYKRKGDACMDLSSVVDVILKAHDFAVIPTGLACEIPKGYEMQIRGRSGMAANYGIGLVNGIGTIDSNYRGDLGVILMNNSNKDFHIEKGMRIAQFAICKTIKIEPIEVENLSETNRGEGRFGSSGLK